MTSIIPDNPTEATCGRPDYHRHCVCEHTEAQGGRCAQGNPVRKRMSDFRLSQSAAILYFAQTRP